MADSTESNTLSASNNNKSNINNNKSNINNNKSNINNNKSNNSKSNLSKRRLTRNRLLSGTSSSDGSSDTKQFKKKKIPSRLRKDVWTEYNGYVFHSKCHIRWCRKSLDVFQFQAGHNIPESKGGSLSINNMRPICGECNNSMGNSYTIDEWNALKPHKLFKYEKFGIGSTLVSMIGLSGYFSYYLMSFLV